MFINNLSFTLTFYIKLMLSQGKIEVMGVWILNAISAIIYSQVSQKRVICHCIKLNIQIFMDLERSILSKIPLGSPLFMLLRDFNINFGDLTSSASSAFCFIWVISYLSIHPLYATFCAYFLLPTKLESFKYIPLADNKILQIRCLMT